jgi:hypothetical protein
MAGTMVSKYKCDLRAWESFEFRLKATQLFMEMEGSLDTSVFYEIKEEKDGPHGVFLTAEIEHDSEKGDGVDSELDWIVKNAGDRPRSSFDNAAQIERLILSCGGICYHSPVQVGRK